MKLEGRFSYPTSVRFGAGRITELPEAISALGMTRPLFVTDRNLATHPMTRKVLSDLTYASVSHGLFTRVDPNPTESDLEQGLEAFRDGGHDGVVAFGGGSALDVGKLIAFMAGQTRPVWDFEDIGDYWTRADPSAIRPIIAVPTTAGTGSELGRAGVITNGATKAKKIIFHPKMLPGEVICDPALTTALPAHITAGTGMDALAHCLEAYCSPHFHPMSQGIAVEGMRLVLTYLPRAFADGDDLEARANMMAAASMGAVAFQKGLGAIHALSHPIGAVHNTHHGTTNAVVMPSVLRFNRPAIAEKIERAMGYWGVHGDFEAFVAHIEKLNESFEIPANLTALGVTNPDIDALTHAALQDPSVGGNPVEMTWSNTRALLQDCLGASGSAG